MSDSDISVKDATSPMQLQELSAQDQSEGADIGQVHGCHKACQRVDMSSVRPVLIQQRTCTHICMCACVDLHIRTYIYIYVHVHIVYMYMCVYVSMDAWIPVSFVFRLALLRLAPKPQSLNPEP